MANIKPILFNTDMVRAILDGRKTVTRRVVKPQPICYGPNITFTPHSNDFFISAEKGWIRCRNCGNDPEYSQEGSNISHHWKPPYQPGDILYVRETWCYGSDTTQILFEPEPRAYDIQYKADYPHIDKDLIRWRPSIHMPKEAARIWLKVTNVRVERLQDITREQAEREGACDYTSTADGFADIWDSTVKKSDAERYGWCANPWVWVIEFERCEKPQEVSR